MIQVGHKREHRYVSHERGKRKVHVVTGTGVVDWDNEAPLDVKRFKKMKIQLKNPTDDKNALETRNRHLKQLNDADIKKLEDHMEQVKPRFHAEDDGEGATVGYDNAVSRMSEFLRNKNRESK